MTENKAQTIAINHHLGPMLVLAGPGSGKTHVITKRIEYLINEYKVRPEEILVITFTKYAAKEMKERFYRQYGRKVPVTFGTFHGIFYGILKWAYHIDASNILSEEDKAKLIREILVNDRNIDESLEIQMDDEKDFVSNIGREISLIKSEGLNINTYESKECPSNIFRNIFKGYESGRKKLRKIDFDDMIQQCYILLKNNPEILQKWQSKFKFILIDEFQDINQMQFDTIKLLAEPEDNIFVVGDDDQSIYGFRGARPDIMLDFKKVYQTAISVTLDTNYRSTKAIVNGSKKVISNNTNRYKKEIYTINEQGDTIHIQEVKHQIEESEYVLQQILELQKKGISNTQIAVLFRTNLDARILAGKLLEYGIPFQMKESFPNIFEHFIGKDIISYMELVLGNRNRNHFLRVMNKPNRYIGRDAIAQGPVVFEALRSFYCDKEWMQDRIDQLELDLRIMKNMTPYALIQFIRKRVGYDEFLKEYATFRKMNLDEVYETLEEIQEHAKSIQTMESWLEYVEAYGQKLKVQMSNRTKRENAIDLHTMHGSKGLEYDFVYIIGCNEGVTPSKKAELPNEIEEERRMFYVAMTRAKKKLTIVYPKQKHGKDIHPSRFVHELLD